MNDQEKLALERIRDELAVHIDGALPEEYAFVLLIVPTRTVGETTIASNVHQNDIDRVLYQACESFRDLAEASVKGSTPVPWTDIFRRRAQSGE